jgi:hypothetical protein
MAEQDVSAVTAFCEYSNSKCCGTPNEKHHPTCLNKFHLNLVWESEGRTALQQSSHYTEVN